MIKPNVRMTNRKHLQYDVDGCHVVTCVVDKVVCWPHIIC